MNRFISTLRRPLTTIVIILTLFLMVISKKIAVLSADPKGEKNCPPLFPQYMDENGKNMQIFMEEPQHQIEWKQVGGMINDASCLNATSVYGIAHIQSEKDIHEALTYARNNDLKVTMSGAKHSMGGHAFYKGAVVLDMLGYNKILLNESERTVTVQSGATWHDIQNLLHPKYAVKAMQSTDIFTVGGSISVNAHGMDHQVGALSRTIRSLNLMLPDGTVKKVSRTENSELFRLVVGGYGMFGVILDVELEITDNEIYTSKRLITDYKEFPQLFEQDISKNTDIGLMYMHLSTSPSSFLEEMIVYSYEKIHESDLSIPPLGEVGSVKLRRFAINIAKYGSVFKRFKWWSEKYLEPKMESCSITRNQAMKDGEACLVSRNEPMHDSVKYTKNRIPNDTDILHEYFVPRDQFISFVDGMRTLFQEQKTNVLNASVRVVHAEENFLSYAPQDSFSIVLYINQSTDDTGNEKMKKITQDLIDLTLEHKGRFFLPYQLHFTPEQLEAAYPELQEFTLLKKQYDPEEILTSTFYEKYFR
ncbi:MAG: FAD-binding oxidoreductase [Candidatus Gracilibacteria bacterium]|nr:FAD-binding oxidoreductase [Candidatus Gracilibacteria bacterium]